MAKGNKEQSEKGDKRVHAGQEKVHVKVDLESKLEYNLHSVLCVEEIHQFLTRRG